MQGSLASLMFYHVHNRTAYVAWNTGDIGVHMVDCDVDEKIYHGPFAMPFAVPLAGVSPRGLGRLQLRVTIRLTCVAHNI